VVIFLFVIIEKMGIMDIFQADIVFNYNKYRTLEDLKTMNKKFTFAAVLKGQRSEKVFG